MTSLPVVGLVVLAAAEVMGQQRYEREVFRAVAALSTTEVKSVRVASMRSSLPHERRLPLQASTRGGIVSATCARVAYRGLDVVHRCDLRLPPAGRVPEVLTIHDFAFLRFQDEGHVAPYSLASVKDARIVLTPSVFIADEVRERTGHEDVRVAHNGVGPDLAKVVPASALERATLGPGQAPYAFHGGGASSRKNLVGLAEAWREVSRVNPEIHLVLAGPTDSRRTNLFKPLPRTHLVGHLPRPLLLRAMAGARLVVVPSEYEGFGLPGLEAMALAVPVVASACASLPEIIGDAGLLVAPTGAGLAQGIFAVLDRNADGRQQAIASQARAARFTWEASAEVHLKAYADAYSWRS